MREQVLDTTDFSRGVGPVGGTSREGGNMSLSQRSISGKDCEVRLKGNWASNKEAEGRENWQYGKGRAVVGGRKSQRGSDQLKK